jgi:hypothetical protein
MLKCWESVLLTPGPVVIELTIIESIVCGCGTTAPWSLIRGGPRELDEPTSLLDGDLQEWAPTTLLARILSISKHPYIGPHVVDYTDGSETVSG